MLTAAAALASGCSEEGLAFTPPYISASAETLDFGEITVGTSDQRTITIFNKGETTMTVELPSFDSLNDVFGVQLDAGQIEPNKDVVLAVRFRPARAGVFTTTVTVTNNSSNRGELHLTLKGTGISPGPCDGVECRRAPTPVCISQNATRRYLPDGTCDESNGRCVHEFNDETCAFGCDDTTGLCRGDPCTGLSCSTPPNNCYFANGVCENGACRFEVNNAGQCDDGQACTTQDRCSEGTCVGTTRTCTTAPEAFCVDSNTRRVFTAQGTCNPANGGCEYTSQDQRCEFGCTPGGCTGDPCAGIVCNTPPAGGCYQPNGTCNQGVCSYTAVGGTCDDGNACTTGDTCNNGSCVGTPMVCNTPPAPDCSSATDRRVYNANGTCNAGVCEYTPNVAACNDNNQCTTSDRCQNGMCVSSGSLGCADTNPCTTDSCDPIAGCVHTPSSGNACVTGSGECPTGICSAGTCLTQPGVTCVTEIDLDLCQDVEVAGVCSASGQCVVSQAPPQFTCPGCNGICITCFIQLCFPF